MRVPGCVFRVASSGIVRRAMLFAMLAFSTKEDEWGVFSENFYGQP